MANPLTLRMVAATIDHCHAVVEDIREADRKVAADFGTVPEILIPGLFERSLLCRTGFVGGHIALLVGVLGNGDSVGVAKTWKWQNALAGLHVCDLDKVQDAISEGEWAENSQATNWAGHAVAKALDLDIDDKSVRARIKSLLKTWIADKVLRVERRHDTREGRKRAFIVPGART